jgi:hypothetical protein
MCLPHTYSPGLLKPEQEVTTGVCLIICTEPSSVSVSPRVRHTRVSDTRTGSAAQWHHAQRTVGAARASRRGAHRDCLHSRGVAGACVWAGQWPPCERRAGSHAERDLKTCGGSQQPEQTPAGISHFMPCECRRPREPPPSPLAASPLRRSPISGGGTRSSWGQFPHSNAPSSRSAVNAE